MEYNYRGYPVVTSANVATALDLPKCPPGNTGSKIKKYMIMLGWKYKGGVKIKGRSHTIYYWNKKWGDHPESWNDLAKERI